MREIDNSKIVVVIQSENSIASREVPKEVSVALDKHKTVIPFVLDDAELRGDLEYDLIGINRVIFIGNSSDNSFYQNSGFT